MWLKLRAAWPLRDGRQRPLPNCDPLNALGVVGVGGGVVSEGNGSGRGSLARVTEVLTDEQGEEGLTGAWWCGDEGRSGVRTKLIEAGEEWSEFHGRGCGAAS